MRDKTEFRDKKRVLIQRDIVINGIINAHALDISNNGMYISTASDFIKGSVLDIGIEIDNKPIQLKARVQHCQKGIGMGVKFVSLTPEIFTTIRDLLAKAESVETKKSERKVLLLDDNAQSRKIYRYKLDLEGFVVLEATNGIEALKLLQEMKPDLAIIELWIEGIDGFRLLQLMQLNPDLKKIPVLILSSRSVPEDIKKAIVLGAKDYLPKMTTNPIKLAEKVKEFFPKT
jgi:CheY-like chemotaxis protein